jgi:predicted SAM-dependent methyltransferase
MKTPDIKLNIGSSDTKIEGFVGVDLYNPTADVKADAKNLPYEDNTVTSIFASHIIEHFDYYEAREVLNEWKRVLKSEGILTVETPDFLESCKRFVSCPEDQHCVWYGHFFAKPWLPGEVHKFLYTKRELWGQLANVGFKNMKFEEPTMHTQAPNIRIVCQK